MTKQAQYDVKEYKIRRKAVLKAFRQLKKMSMPCEFLVKSMNGVYIDDHIKEALLREI